jgi:hypothetical protein
VPVGKKQDNLQDDSSQSPRLLLLVPWPENLNLRGTVYCVLPARTTCSEGFACPKGPCMETRLRRAEIGLHIGSEYPSIKQCTSALSAVHLGCSRDAGA